MNELYFSEDEIDMINHIKDVRDIVFMNVGNLGYDNYNTRHEKSKSDRALELANRFKFRAEKRSTNARYSNWDQVTPIAERKKRAKLNELGAERDMKRYDKLREIARKYRWS